MTCLSELLRIFESQWSDLTILYAEPWSEPWILQPGIRDDFEIYLVEKGQGVVTMGGESHPVGEGDAFVLYSLDGNAFTPTDGSDFRMGLVTFRLSGAPEHEVEKQKLIDGIRASGLTYDLRDPSSLLDILYRMNREMILRTPGHMFRLKAMLVQFVMLLQDQSEQNKIAARPLDADSRHSVDEIAVYLYEHADSPITLAQIAARVNLNPRYICTLYRRYTGKSIMEHLQEIRVGRAQRLLTHTPLSITDIAYETGFSSGQYFARIFKRMTGLTPGQYRTYQR